MALRFRPVLYDSRCEDLAALFLEEVANATHADVVELAGAIQTLCEDSIMMIETRLNSDGRVEVNLVREPEFRIDLSEQAKDEIDRLERAQAEAVAHFRDILTGES